MKNVTYVIVGLFLSLTILCAGCETTSETSEKDKTFDSGPGNGTRPVDDSDRGPDTDRDTGSDTDADTDTDMDADADTDSDTDADADTATGEPVDTGSLTDEDKTIYEIQRGEIVEKTVVTLKDVIVTTPLTADGKGLWIQEPDSGEFGGIFVYLFKEVSDAHGPKMGDLVTLTGQYLEYSGVSEIKVKNVDDFKITGSADLPEPQLVDGAKIGQDAEYSEKFEGVLVQVVDVAVTNADLGHGEWEVASSLVIDDMFFTLETAPKPFLGQVYDSIIGPLHHSFNTFKIEPRNAEDLVSFDVEDMDAGVDDDTDSESEVDTDIDTDTGDVTVDTATDLDGGVVDDDCLIISEYIEGNSYNKAIELFNCGKGEIDLNKYNVCMLDGKQTVCTANLALDGALSPCGVVTICNSQIKEELFNQDGCDYTKTNVANFNGDERLMIQKGEKIADAFGDPFTLPGSQLWKQLSLRRKNFTPYLGTGEFDYTFYFESGEVDDFSDFGIAPVTDTCPQE